MNTAAKGRAYEHRSRALLEAAGYTVVRSARSGGLWDLVGYNAAGFVLVQVKCGAWPRRGEMAALSQAQVPPNALKLVHRWLPGRDAPQVRVVP